MSRADTDRDLRERCSAALKAGVSWGELWLLIVAHKRYEKLLERCAKNAVRRSLLPRDWWEDIASEVRLGLAKRLSQDVCLEADLARVDQEYLTRLVKVTRNLCRQAVRSAEHKFLGRASAINADGLAAVAPPEGLGIDFQNALSHLSDRQRLAVVLRFSDRCKLREIADKLGITKRQAEYALQQAMARLRRLIPPPQDSHE